MDRRKAGIFAAFVGILALTFAAASVIFHFPGITQEIARDDAIVGLIFLAIGIIQINRAA
jgi:hypothetical protein